MIVALEEAKQKLVALRAPIKELGAALRLEETRDKVKEMESRTQDPAFWNNTAESSKVLQAIKQGQDKITAYDKLCARLEDAITLAEMAIEENDEDSVEEIQTELKEISEEAENKRIETLLCGQYDRNNAIISFHPGAGGTEAQDWCQMLYRMITRWCDRHGFKYKLTDWLDGDEAGLKAATIFVEGENAYGYLKSENGVHRLVRISPFDANARRQTSFSSLEVMPELDNNIKVEINPADIEMQVYRSSGAGGQHINKTSSAVRLIHKPTGIVTSCQTQRSQLQNREYAMEMLKAKLYQIALQQHKDKVDDIKGVQNEIAWGHQIRSYVFMPYTLVKDHRTNYESGNVQAVMDGDLDGFIYAYLKASSRGELQDV